jgi:integration host factor subunit alpha
MDWQEALGRREGSRSVAQLSMSGAGTSVSGTPLAVPAWGFGPVGNTGVRMTQKTVTRADLAEAVYGSVGLSRTESAELVERVLELIGDALITGANVKLSSFGSFQVRSKNERIGRNPKTGEEVPILPRQVLVFKPSNVLKSKINKSMVSAGK